MLGRMQDETPDTLMVPATSAKSLNAVTFAENEAGLALPPNSSDSQSYRALVKLASSAISHDRKQMGFLLIFNVAMGILIGTWYSNIANDEKDAMENVRCIFHTIIFTIFIGMAPTIITCE